MDYFRTDCIKSYFELVALVNKGNRVINEQTKASFFISNARLFIGIDNGQKIALCKRRGYWLQATDSGHERLEIFICSLLNKNKIISGNVDELIKRELFKLPS